MKKQVVIIGGGYGGLESAKQLDKTRFDVTIVDAKPYFEHVIGVYHGVRYKYYIVQFITSSYFGTCCAAIRSTSRAAASVSAPFSPKPTSLSTPSKP